MFERAFEGKKYNCIETGTHQYHLYELHPIRPGSKVHRAKYIVRNWKDTVSYPTEWEETNELIKIENAGGLKKIEHEIALQKIFPTSLKQVVTDDETHYMVMKNDGENLKSYLARMQPDFRERTRIVLRLLHEVSLLEKAGIIHNRIELENICIKKNVVKRKVDEKEIKLEQLDLRLVGFGSSQRADTKDNANIKKMDYRWVCNDAEASHATDRFALAPVIAEIFGANYGCMVGQRHSNYCDLLDRQKKGKKADFSQLPAYDFTKALQDFSVPEFSALKGNLISLFRSLTSADPDNRPSIDYLMHFFLEIENAQEKMERLKKEASTITATATKVYLNVTNTVDTALTGAKDFFVQTGEVLSHASEYVEPISTAVGNLASNVWGVLSEVFSNPVPITGAHHWMSAVYDDAFDQEAEVKLPPQTTKPLPGKKINLVKADVPLAKAVEKNPLDATVPLENLCDEDKRIRKLQNKNFHQSTAKKLFGMLEANLKDWKSIPKHERPEKIKEEVERLETLSAKYWASVNQNRFFDKKQKAAEESINTEAESRIERTKIQTQLKFRLEKIAEYRNRIKTKSSGLRKIFDKIDSDDTVENKLKAICRIARKRLEQPKTWYQRKRNPKIRALYEDFASIMYENDSLGDSRGLLAEILGKLNEYNQVEAFDPEMDYMLKSSCLTEAQREYRLGNKFQQETEVLKKMKI
jgi:hypothetical protein